MLLITAKDWYEIKNNKGIYDKLTDNNKRFFWEFGNSNGLVPHQNLGPQTKAEAYKYITKDFYDPSYIDKKSTTQSLTGSEADKQLAEIQKDEARYATRVVPNRVISNAPAIAEAVSKGKNPPEAKTEFLKKYTTTPIIPYTTTPILRRPVVGLAQTNMIQNLKEQALEPQRPTEYKRPLAPVSNRLQEDFNLPQTQTKQVEQKQYTQLTPREQQIALGVIKPTEAERQALNVKMSVTPESTFAQNFFKAGSFGATSLIGSDAEKQARLQGEQQNPEAAIGGQISGSLMPQGILYKALDKAIKGTSLGAKLFGSANIGTKIAASQGAQLLGDTIVNAPIAYFDAINKDKTLNQGLKDFAFDRGIDVLINAVLGGFEFTPEIKQMLFDKKSAKRIADIGSTPQAIVDAVETNNKELADDIKNKLDVFYVNQYGVAGKSLDEVNQPLLLAPQKPNSILKPVEGQTLPQAEYSLGKKTENLYEPSQPRDVFSIEDRATDTVGNKTVKAYQVQNEEVKPYYKKLATELLSDLEGTLPGGRSAVWSTELGQWVNTSTKRQSSELLGKILDETTDYAKVKKALQRIIEGKGAESNATSKRIELIMDDALSQGYKTYDGVRINPNQDYINAKALGEFEATAPPIKIVSPLKKRVLKPTAKKVETKKENFKERPFVVTKSELANQSPQIAPTLKPIKTPVVKAQNPIMPSLKKMDKLETKLNNPLVKTFEDRAKKQIESPKVDSNPFKEKDISYFDNELEADAQDVRRSNYIDEMVKKSETMQLQRKNAGEGSFVIYHPSTKGEGGYQLTYFQKGEPILDAQFKTKQELADRLKEDGYGIPVKENVSTSNVEVKPSKFETNTVKRTNVIDEIVKKENIKPNSMDYVPETVKQWDEQAVKNVSDDIEAVKARIKNANSIEGGTMAHEAALITAKLQDDALKTGDFTEFKKWINEIAEKTRETARGLKGTDTAWEKSSVSAVNKLNRTIIKAQEDLVEQTPKLKKAMDNEFNAIKSTFENLPSDEQAIKQMISDLETALKNSNGKQKIKMNLQLFAAKQKLKSLSEVSGDFDSEYVKNWIKKQYGVPTLEDEDIKQIVKFIDQSQNATDDYMKRAYISQAKKIISSKQASTVGEKIRGSLRISMLLNPKTLLTRNPVGNVLLGTLENIKDAPGTLIDKLVSLKTGERTTSLSLGNLVEQTKGFKKGIEEFAKDVKYGIDTNPTGGQMEAVDKILFQASERDWKSVSKLKGFMNSLDRATKLALQLGDRPFYEAALSGRLNELKRLGKNIQDPDVIANAKLYALEKVLQNDSELSKRASAIRDKLGVFGYAVMPFTKTPANILDKLVDYSPVGLAKGVYQLGYDTAVKGKPFDQKLFVDRMARSLSGLGIMGLGGIMYDKGVLTEGYNRDADVRDVQKRMGIQPYAITNGKDYYTIDWASPVASLLIAGLEYRKASKDNKDFAEKIAKGTEAGANSLLNSSFLRGVLDTLSGYSPAAGIAKGVTGGTSQFLPTFVGQATRLSDKYERDTGGTLLGNLASKTPIARQNLPIKLDVYGNEILANQGRGIASRAFQEFISPGFYSSNKGNDVDKELIRLYNSTEIKKMFPKLDEINPSKYTNSPVLISPENKREFRKIVGQKTLDLYSRFINSEYYKGLETDKEKANALYSEMEDLRDEVSREFLKKQGVKITK